MTENAYNLTAVKTDYQEGALNYRLLFGNPVDAVSHITARNARTHYFRPGSIFGLYLWEAGEYGTTRAELYICRALWPGEGGRIVPQVKPGAEILLYSRGVRKTKEALLWLEELKRASTPDLATLDASRYIVAHHRFRSRIPPRR